MNETKPNSDTLNSTLIEQTFKGIYGNYVITTQDKKEVNRYRISLLLSGISFLSGLIQWLVFGPNLAWIWLLPFAIGIGLALKWIHIYLKPLHKTLQILWGVGCIGILILIINLGSSNLLSSVVNNPFLLLILGPLFAALTGIGFKEFFCFRRIEAIGLTILVPFALLGHLSGIFGHSLVMCLLISSAVLLNILSLRKFGMEAASDVGDKSIFEYLQNQNNLREAL